MEPNKNKNLSYFFFILFFIGIIIVWRGPVDNVMTIKDWLKLLILEYLAQTGFHYANKKKKS